MKKNSSSIDLADTTLMPEISKTRAKREMEDLQKLGVALSKLSSEQLAKVELPDTLRDAIILVKKITSNGALRRQHQYIGKLMRGVDSEYIQDKLDEFNNKSANVTRILHLAENWRSRLLKDDSELSFFISEYPQVDISSLRSLIRVVRKELINAKNFNYRRLYQFIRDIIKETK
jgi:ribosome-associated protein